MDYDEQVWKASVKNGEIPANRLAYIWPEQFDPDLNGPARMQPEAALAMGAMLRQAWEDLGDTQLRVKYSYRTLTVQEHKWDLYKAGVGNLAAIPGTSNHGWGIAVDLTGLGPEELHWLGQNSQRWGYNFPVVGENWHAQYIEHNNWIKAGGPEMTEDEKKMLTWLKGFQEGSTANLPGRDTGPAMGKALADAAKHAESVHVSRRHTHGKVATGTASTGPAVEPS